MLNGQQMGGKRRSAYHYDLWSMKYLPKFKWDHLTEEICASPSASLPTPFSTHIAFLTGTRCNLLMSFQETADFLKLCSSYCYHSLDLVYSCIRAFAHIINFHLLLALG